MNNKIDNGNPLRFLHIEDSPLDAEIIRERLIDSGYPIDIDWARNEQEFAAFLERGGYDIILADYNIPGFDAPAVLQKAQSFCPGVPFICVSGAIGEEKAVELLKQGATDYVSKNRLDKLPLAVTRAISEIRERNARKQAEEELRESNEYLSRFNRAATNRELRMIELKEEINELYESAGQPPRYNTGSEDIIESIQANQVDVKNRDDKITLPEAGMAALNLLDDAVRARKQAEQVNDKLLQEISERMRAEEDLQESEQEFHNLAEAMPQIVWITRPDGWNIYFNQQWVDYTGLTMEESRGNGWNKPFHPDDQHLAWNAWQHATKYSVMYSLECRLRRADGVYKWWLVRGVPVHDTDGNIVKWYGTCTDIDEFKQAEQELQKSEQQHRKILQTAMEGFWLVDVQGHLLEVNDTYCRMSGYSEQELLAMRIPDLETNETADDVAEHIQKIVSHGEDRFESQHHRKDGTIYDVENSVQYDPRDGGQFVVFLRDITERKHAELALQESEIHYRSLVEGIPGIVYSYSSKRGGIYYSSHVTALLGYTPEQLYAQPLLWNNSIHPDDLPVVAQAIGESAASKSFRIEYRIRDAAGNWHWLVDRSFGYKIDGDDVIIEGLALDITERKQAEEALRESHNMVVNLTAQVPGVVYQYRLYPDGHSAFPFSSPGMYDIYEVTSEDVREDATAVFGRLHPDDSDRVATSIMESAQTLQMFYCEFRVILPRQGLRWRWSQARPERMEDGSTLWYGIISDITDRKLAEDALHESEQRVQKKLSSILSPEDDLGELELEDIIDVGAIQHLMDEFYELTGVPNAIIDLKGKVLVGTGWQDICTKFHRIHPETLSHCIECDTVLSKDVQPGTFRTYLCKNNMWDCVTPLIVGGQHVGNLFTGQFFFEGEKPDDSVFLAQAAKYGFDEEEYMAAVRRAPVWDRDTINIAFEFYVTLASIITSLSHSNITLAKMLEARKLVEEEKRKFYRDTIKSVTQGKLDLVSFEEVEEYLDPDRFISSVVTPEDTSVARRKTMDFCALCGLKDDRNGIFESAIGEAITNSIKHANGCKVYAGIIGNSIWVAIADTGDGISTMLLPGATLRRGFSSKVSMGVGYTIMMEAVDNMLLQTGPEGTTIVLSVNAISSRLDISLDDFQDTWNEIPNVG